MFRRIEDWESFDNLHSTFVGVEPLLTSYVCALLLFWGVVPIPLYSMLVLLIPITLLVFTLFLLIFDLISPLVFKPLRDHASLPVHLEVAVLRLSRIIPCCFLLVAIVALSEVQYIALIGHLVIQCGVFLRRFIPLCFHAQFFQMETKKELELKFLPPLYLVLLHHLLTYVPLFCGGVLLPLLFLSFFPGHFLFMFFIFTGFNTFLIYKRIATYSVPQSSVTQTMIHTFRCDGGDFIKHIVLEIDRESANSIVELFEQGHPMIDAIDKLKCCISNDIAENPVHLDQEYTYDKCQLSEEDRDGHDIHPGCAPKALQHFYSVIYSLDEEDKSVVLGILNMSDHQFAMKKIALGDKISLEFQDCKAFKRSIEMVELRNTVTTTPTITNNSIPSMVN